MDITKNTIDYIRIFCRFVVFVVRCNPATTATDVQYVFSSLLLKGASLPPIGKEK